MFVLLMGGLLAGDPPMFKRSAVVVSSNDDWPRQHRGGGCQWYRINKPSCLASRPIPFPPMMGVGRKGDHHLLKACLPEVSPTLSPLVCWQSWPLGLALSGLHGRAHCSLPQLASARPY